MKATKSGFGDRVKAWMDDFTQRFEGQVDTQNKRKEHISSVSEDTKKQKTKVGELLEHPRKSKLVKNFNETVETTKFVLEKKKELKLARVIEGEEIENHFIPSYSTFECSLPKIDKDTEADKSLYGPEFTVLQDKFKLGAKVIQNKKSKSVNVSLRISKPNKREKQYEVLLFSKVENRPLGQYILQSEKDKDTESHILLTEVMNTK